MERVEFTLSIVLVRNYNTIAFVRNISFVLVRCSFVAEISEQVNVHTT